MADGRSAADHPREVRLILQKTVGAFVGQAARIGGRSQPIGRGDAMLGLALELLGLALELLGPAWVCRTGRLRSSLGSAALVSLTTVFQRWLPCGRKVLARSRASVFGHRGPVVSRLLVTKLVLAVGREQVLTVIEALVPAVRTWVVRPALEAGCPELVCSRPALLFGARIPDLIGARTAELTGARIPDLISARIPELISARIPELTGARIPELTGARIPELISARTADLISARTADLTGARTADLISARTGARIPDLIGARTTDLIRRWALKLIFTRAHVRIVTLIGP